MRDWLTIILSLCTLSVSAQQLTLKECIEEGLERSYQIRMVKIEEKQAENNNTWSYAGALPTLNLGGTYSGSVNGGVNHNFNATLRAEWTLFNGFSILSTHSRLEEMQRMGTIQSRIAIENYIADVAAEYYNLVRQNLRLKNLNYAVALSRERMRIIEARYDIGNNSKLELRQAQVYFNADSAKSLKQQELVASAKIRINRLLANDNTDYDFNIADTIITLIDSLDYGKLYESMMATNSSILRASSNKTLAELDKKSIVSRNYPYLKVNAGYGYNGTIGGVATRSSWGPTFGATVGMSIIDGKQRTQQRNATLNILHTELERENVELQLISNLDDLWQAYQNNLLLLNLERENLLTARENHQIAYERYMLGNLSGIEMREAQKSMLDAEESLLQVEYDIKLCEISLLQLSGALTNYIE